MSPHFSAVGGVTQTVPSQHPAAQVVALHGATHDPLEQVRPAAQATQLAPEDPHAPSALPARHAPPVSLHPVVQTVAAQAPLWHDWPALHATQAVPIEPQVWLVFPPRQKPSTLQHPRQLPQRGVPPPAPPEPPPDPPPAPPPVPAHLASTQLWLEPHSAQTSARTPQAKVWVPSWQSPFLSQQPAQFEGLQAGFPPPLPHDGATEMTKPSRAPTKKCRSDIRSAVARPMGRSKRGRTVMVWTWPSRSSIST